jgi:hypothetical protein
MYHFHLVAGTYIVVNHLWSSASSINMSQQILTLHSISSHLYLFSQVFTLRSLPLELTKRVTVTLGAALSSTLLNLFFLEPYSTKIMFERYDLENKEGGLDTDRYKVLKKTFGKMHGMSSLSNLIALCGAVAHGFILSSLLVG